MGEGASGGRQMRNVPTVTPRTDRPAGIRIYLLANPLPGTTCLLVACGLDSMRPGDTREVARSKTMYRENSSRIEPAMLGKRFEAYHDAH